MAEFRVGDKVEINMTSKFVKQGLVSGSLRKMEGIITSITDDQYPIDVEWEDKTNNCYGEKDLVKKDLTTPSLKITKPRKKKPKMLLKDNKVIFK